MWVIIMPVGVGAPDDPHLKPSNKKARPLGELSSERETERAYPHLNIILNIILKLDTLSPSVLIISLTVVLDPVLKVMIGEPNAV